jgi:8-oxo-dGTP pyrophosphatase MutT (NUDIX family)
MSINPKKISQLLARTRTDQISTCPPLPGILTEAKQPAAVLIPLLKDEEIWKILFIKRTVHQNDRHSGQIAFPGGRFDSEDLILERTALRETYEEIGLNPESVNVLGQSRSMITVTGYEVTPFVGVLPWPIALNLSQDEVEKTLLIPLDWLRNPENHRTELWRSSSVPDIELPVIFYKEYGGEVLWGASAQILVDFLELIGLMP